VLTLSNGFKKPQDNDSSTQWFDAMEGNVQQLNDHTHNGVDSEPLAISAIDVTTQSISSASWVATSGGTYRQLVTMPVSLTAGSPALTYDDVALEFRLSTGDIIHPSVEKASSTTFYVYINDNTLNLVAIYTS
jgi:hypothetical protein